MRKLIPAILFVLLLSACGPRWTYTNLDWLVPWYIEEYIALDPQQDDELSVRLAYQLDWHCRTQLTRYAVFLRQWRGELDVPGQPIPAARWADYFDQLKQYWVDLIHQVGPDAVAIMVTASDDQIETLFENIEERNRDLDREYVDPPIDARRRNRQKRMQKRIAYWTGPLTGTQKEMVAQWARGITETAEDWMAHHRRFQAALHRQLDQRRPGEDFERGFLDLFATPEKLRDPSFQKKIDINKRLTCHFLENLSRSLTDKQRRHIVARLDKLIDDMEQLSCEPEQTATGNGTMTVSDGITLNLAALK